jgi:serine/threonine-protein kinase
MHAPHDSQTVAGGDAATVNERQVPDQTGAPQSIGPATAGMLGREILGQYRVLSKLGRGGMGTVFLAEQASMHRQVAIKVLHADVSDNAEAARRFQQEAQAAARLDSPHIVTVYNFGRLDTGELYLAMEYLQGRSLHDELATYGQLPLARVLDVVGQLARGLDEAHRNGVVHRDLKPGNIMLVPRPEGELAKLLDFGIAKLDAGMGTQTGGWVGTPRYMAPEQFTGESVDARTDVYALGLITYEMLCGRTPFVSDNPMSYVHSHVYSAVPSMQQVAPGLVSPAVEAVVLSALAKAPSQRPPSAGAFFEALQRALYSPPPRKRSSAPVFIAATLGVLVFAGVGAFACGRWAERDTSTPSSSSASTSASSDQAAAAVAADFDPAYVAQLPPEHRALVEADEDELLAKLDEVLEAFPPSTRKQSRSQYTLQLAAIPRDAGAVARKTLLIQAIIAMSQSLQYLPQDSRSTKTLIQEFLDRPGPLPRANRQEVIDNMLSAQVNKEDAEWVLRQWLLQMEAQEVGAAKGG